MGRGRRASRGSRRTQGRRNYGVHIGDEFLTFSVSQGQTSTFTIGNISTMPARCNFRPLFACTEVTAAYIPGTANDSTPGYFSPAAIDLQLTNPSGDIVSTSRPTVLGANPRRVWARYPRSGDWFPYTSPPTTKLGTINAVCLGQPGYSNGYIRGVIHIRYQFSYEVLIAVCPKFLTDDPPTPSSPASTSHLSKLSWWEQIERDESAPQ